MAQNGRPERRIWHPDARDVRRDVDDELAFHLDMRRRDFAARGLAEAAAREAAERRFGDRAAVAAACRHIDEGLIREQRRASMWMDLRQDFSYAVRSLFRTPGFTLVALLTLTLGIGANTAIFSLTYGLLFRPLPYANEDRLIFLWSSSPFAERMPQTPGRLVDFREQLTSVDAIAGISQISLNLTDAGEAERVAASSVSSSFFDLLGVRPLYGDVFHTGTSDTRVVVLSHRLWLRRFGGDPSIVGRDIAINLRPRRVAAIMPPEFDWPVVTAFQSGPIDGPELWIPGNRQDIPGTHISLDDDNLATDRRSGYLRIVARLKPGVSYEQARQEAGTIAERIGRQHPSTDGGRGAVIVPLRRQFFGGIRQPLFVLLGAVGFVLAIACANVASLLLGRGAARRREIAIRFALGATRGRVVRQLLVESVALSLGGAALGTVAAAWAVPALVRLSPAGVPSVGGVGLNAPVLAFTAGLAIATGVLFGLVPAWQSSTEARAGDLAEGARASTSPRGVRARDALVAIQIAVAVVLLVASGLLLRSFTALAHVDTGIDTKNLLTFEVSLSGIRAEYQSRQISFYNELLDSIRHIPGVTATGAAVTLPIGGDDFGAPVVIEGQPLPETGKEHSAGFQVTSPGYIAAMGIPVIAGRDFQASDTRDSLRVVIVNRRFARLHWPNDDPLGKRIRVGRPDAPWMPVIGVVEDIRHLGPAVPPRPEFYESHAQRSFPFMSFVVRTTVEPMSVVPAIRAQVARLDPAQPIAVVSTMDDHVRRALARPRAMSAVVSSFGALALLLAVVGVYGVMAWSVAQRTREMAIRMALGAKSVDILRLVLSKAAWIAALGIAVGLGGAFASARALEGMLFGISRTDRATFVTVPLLLSAVAIVAAFVPALRASRVDARALRN
jgi:putative ABC transport system permease protein